jgi:hypothetical protein
MRHQQPSQTSLKRAAFPLIYRSVTFPVLFTDIGKENDFTRGLAMSRHLKNFVPAVLFGQGILDRLVEPLMGHSPLLP